MRDCDEVRARRISRVQKARVDRERLAVDSLADSRVGEVLVWLDRGEVALRFEVGAHYTRHGGVCQISTEGERAVEDGLHANVYGAVDCAFVCLHPSVPTSTSTLPLFLRWKLRHLP